MRIPKTAVVIAAIAAAAAVVAGSWRIVALLFLIITDDDACRLQVASEIPSPSGELKAVLFQYDCGATTPFTTNVSVMPAGESTAKKPGNVFSAYHGSSAGPWGGPNAKIQWLSDRSLKISYIADAKVSLQSSQVGKVAVAYEHLSNPAAD